MPTYRYQISASGPGNGSAAVLRTIEASDRGAALRALLQRGETPTRLEELDLGAPAKAAPARKREPARTDAAASLAPRPSLMTGRVMSRAETGSFIRDLSVAVNAGLPLIAALKTIARQGRSERQQHMLEFLVEKVEGGDTLSDSMAAFGKPYTDLIISLVRAGEAAGKLGETLRHAADLLDRDLKLRRSVLGALLYPMIICVLVVVAVAVVVTVIVPRVLKAVEGQGAITLPLPTRIVQGAASFMGSWWWLILLAGAAGVWLFQQAYNRPDSRLKIDSTLLRIPLMGAMLRDVAVARFTRTLGTLIAAGLPVLLSLRITRATLSNRAMEEAIDGVAEEVASGSTIAEPLERSGYFPSLLVQIVGLGERTGKLDEMMMQAANAFEEKTEQTVKMVTTVLPPLLIVVAALMVGFVILSILLPLLELQDAASKAM